MRESVRGGHLRLTSFFLGYVDNPLNVNAGTRALAVSMTDDRRAELARMTSVVDETHEPPSDFGENPGVTLCGKSRHCRNPKTVKPYNPKTI